MRPNWRIAPNAPDFMRHGAKAHDDDFRAYNQRMDERAASAASELKPLRHIETVTEAGARNRAAWAARDALAARASAAATVVASSLPSMDDDAFDLGEVSEMGAGRTPLGDAAPFEYMQSAASGESETLAGVFMTPAEESECTFQYEADMTECSAWYAVKPSPWIMCKERAADRLGRCLASKGGIF
jgi:hypothetical protein